jgi:hypothetical protein
MDRMADGPSRSKADWPQDVESAVARLLALLSEEDKETVRSTPEDRLGQFHFTWGMGIRNSFGLWAGNQALMDSCAQVGTSFDDPDSASGIIIKAVWNQLTGHSLGYHQRRLYEVCQCETCGRNFYVIFFEEDGFVPPADLRCERCKREAPR